MVSTGRVEVQLTPKSSEGLFQARLRASQKNPKLRIDSVRRSKDLLMVIEHCRRRWKEPLEALGEPPLVLFYHPSGIPVEDHRITIDQLCREANLSAVADAKLTLAYQVMEPSSAAAEHASPTPYVRISPQPPVPSATPAPTAEEANLARQAAAEANPSVPGVAEAETNAVAEAKAQVEAESNAEAEAAMEAKMTKEAAAAKAIEEAAAKVTREAEAAEEARVEELKAAENERAAEEAKAYETDSSGEAPWTLGCTREAVGRYLCSLYHVTNMGEATTMQVLKGVKACFRIDTEVRLARGGVVEAVAAAPPTRVTAPGGCWPARGIAWRCVALRGVAWRLAGRRKMGRGCVPPPPNCGSKPDP